MQIATPSDFKKNALLKRISDGELIRITDHVRGDEFNSIHESATIELTMHSREANYFYLVSDNATEFFDNKNKQ